MAPIVPIAVAIAEGAAGGLITNAIERLKTRITAEGWKDTDDLTRLFMLLESAYSDQIPGFKHGKLGRTLGTDKAFLDIYDRLSVGAPAITPEEQKREHDELVAVIKPYVTDSAEKTQDELAEEVAAFLPYLVPESKDVTGRILSQLRELTGLFEEHAVDMRSRLDRMEEQLQDRAPTLIFVPDWPEAAADALRVAGEVDAPGLAQLIAALKDKDRAAELPKLVRNPRGWMSDLSYAVWELIAVLCEEYGLWDEARMSWVETREKAGAVYAWASMRAAEAAAIAGEDDLAAQLFEDARKDDPTHPRVALREALSLDDPYEALRALEAIQAEDTQTKALAHVASAALHASLRDIDGARASLEFAAQAGAASIRSYRLVQGTIAVAEVLRAPRESVQRIRELVDASLSLEGELLQRNMPAQAAHAREHAIGFYALTQDYGRARRLIADATDIYEAVDAAEPRLIIAMAAAQMESYELVGRLVRPQDTNARARLLRALIAAGGDEEEQQQAPAALERLLDDEHAAIRQFAAMERLALAGKAPDIGWSEKAENILDAGDLPMASAFKAHWLERSDHPDKAELELLGHSDETWAIRELMNLAARQQDWQKAAVRADALLNRNVDWVTRFAAADAIRLADDDARAAEEFEKLADATEAPPEIRAAAFSRLASRAVARPDFGAALSVAEKWLEVTPEDIDARWMKAGTLATLGHDQKALDAIEEWELHPRTENEYEIAAALYGSLAEPVQALRKLVELADEHNPPSEHLEALVVKATLRAGSAIPPELAKRVAAARFFELFPESEQLRRLTLEELQTFQTEAAPEQARRVQEAIEHIFMVGDMPTGSLAALEGGDIGGLWMRLSESLGLPLGYSEPAMEERERLMAEAGFGGAALWDASSIFVVGHVLTDEAEAIRTSFPNGGIAQAALLELTVAARNLRFEESVHEATDNAATSEADETDISEEEAALRAARARERVEHAADESRAQSALEFAHKLSVVPDVDPENPQPEDAYIPPGASSPLQAVFATFGVARRLVLPIYSDDRDVRRRAHAAGLPAFGTMAVLHVLNARSVISNETHGSCRTTLLGARGLGVHATSDELIALGQASGWELTLELLVAVRDAFQWRGRTVPLSMFTWIAILYVVFRTNPDKLVSWVVRILNSIQGANPETPLEPPAQLLVAYALISYEPDATPFARALIRALDRARPYCSRSLGDPARDGFIRLLQAVSLPKHERVFAMTAALRAWVMLPLDDQIRLVGLLF
jgi:hypothetical protein